MLDAVMNLPHQLEGAWARAATLELPGTHLSLDAVVLAGMGGSAIGGDLAASLMADQLASPMVVVRDYRLPSWVGARTLLVASSFSGNTEETLSAYRHGARAGARCVIVSSGGQLTELARSAGDPVVALPGGGQPRAALGNSLANILGVLKAAGLIADPSQPIAEAVACMREAVADYAAGAKNDPASALAKQLHERIPLIYVPQDLDPVGRRWKAQLNENSKMTAAWDTLPELNHNSVVGFGSPALTRDALHVVFLNGPGTPERMQRRTQITADLLDDAGISHTMVRAPAGSRLAEAMWLVQVGDLVSVDLALRLGVDPTPVSTIDRLKAALG
jgi:glucose/mannose-6-phosphate isomerase